MPSVVKAWSNDATSRGPSTQLWRKQQPLIGQRWTDPNQGVGFFDDFNEIMASGSRYALVEADSGSTVSLLGTDGSPIGGTCRLTTGSTAQMEAVIGTSEAALCKLGKGTGRVWFETRVRVSSVTNGVLAFVVGLTQVGSAAANLVTDTSGEVATVDFVGFGVDAADGDALRLLYATASGAVVEHDANASTLAADTFVKLGLFFDGETTLKYYVDGAQVGTSVTATDTATNFPNGELLSLAASVKTISATVETMDIDWWAVLQEIV